MNLVTRMYVRDQGTGRWHEVARDGAGAASVTTYCGRQFREHSRAGAAAPYDKRSSWPSHKAPRCKTCTVKAARRRA